MSRSVHVVGVGVLPFAKPGGEDYLTLGARAAAAAMADAGIDFHQVQQAVAGYVHGDSCCGQAVVYRLGLTGIPVFNVNNTCATGSTALYLARQIVEGGAADCVMVLGFEQTPVPAMPWQDRPAPWQRLVDVMHVLQEPEAQVPSAVRRRRAPAHAALWHAGIHLCANRGEGEAPCGRQSPGLVQ